MNYTDPDIRQQLAAEYVLGTMPERARRRFESQLKLSPALRASVAEWEARLTPMANSVAEITPPRRVWQAIQRRIDGATEPKPAADWWNSLGFWRASTGFATAALVILGLVLGAPAVDPTAAEKTMMVVVMDDTQTRSPAMTVSWRPGGEQQRMLRLRVIGHAEMAPDTA